MIRQLLQKIPLAWLQVTREKTRLTVALAGIAFADILMFIQIGFKDALYEASVKPHYLLNTDLVLINPQFETLFAVKSFPRDRLYQALRVDGVESVNALYISSGQWRNPQTRVERTILIFGADPAKSVFNLPEIQQNLDKIKPLNQVLFDRAGRPEYGDIDQLMQQSGSVTVQLNKQEIQVAGLFTLGASFAADGNVIASDSTFLRLFPQRQPQEIDVGLLKVTPGRDIQQLKTSLQTLFPKDELLVLTLEEFANREKVYWANSTAIGFIFGLGAAVGFVVGIVIVYQILYSDVSDHLPEYATLKAMGYGDRYLIGVLMQEAILLAILGYFPGFFASFGIYNLAQGATLLPIFMTVERAITVFILNIIMCTASGLISLRKLQTADPAEIF